MGPFYALLAAWLIRELAECALAACGVVTRTLRRGQAKPKKQAQP
jgi:hypothetical protein